MKSFILSLIISIVVSSVFSQENFLLTSGSAFDNFSYKRSAEKEKEIRIKNNIALRRGFSLNAKGQQVLNTETRYDKNGNWTEKSYYNKKGGLKFKWTGVCNDDGKYTEIKREKNSGKISDHTKRDFNENNNLISFTYSRNGVKIKSQGKLKYDDNNNCLEAIYSGSNTDKPHRWTYSYYDDGKNKETILYNKNGKEKHRWNYNCDPKGQEVEKKKTEVCKKTEVDENGNKTIVYLYEDQKQRIKKVVIVYDKNDNKLSYTRYKNSGKIRSKDLSTFDLNNNKTSHYFYGRNQIKPLVMYQFEYDSNNNRVKENLLKRNMTVKSSYILEFQTF